MSYEMTGTVKQVNDTMTFPSGFSKREFVVTTPEQYPQDVVFETVKDKTSMLDSLKPGQEVTVHFDIRGREYNGRHFVNLNAWRIQTDGQGGASPGPVSDDIPPMDTDLPESSDESDFPF
jgi:cold shock CspA family protein